MNPNNNYTSKLLSLLRSTGNWFNYKDKRSFEFYFPLFRMTLMSSVTLASTLSLYLIGFKESLNGISMFIPSLTIINIQLLTQLLQQTQLEYTLNTLHETLNFFTENWEMSILKKAHKIAWKIIDFYKWMIFLTWLFYFTLPPVIDIIIYFTGYELRAFNLPLPLSGYLDKNPPRTFKNSMVLALSIFWSIFSFSGHVGAIGTFFSLIMYTHAIMQIFNLSVDHLNFSKEHVNASLAKIINMHRNIIKLDEGLKKVYGLGFLLQNIMISICLCMSLFTISNAQNKMVLIAYIFGLFYYASLSVICCILGQLIENESDKMLVTVSNIPWFDMTPKIRKNIILILLQSNRMIEISFKGYSPLNFNTLMAIFNTTYSYFTLLQSVM